MSDEMILKYFLLEIIQQYIQSRCSTGLQASGHGVTITFLSDGTAPKKCKQTPEW